MRWPLNFNLGREYTRRKEENMSIFNDIMERANIVSNRSDVSVETVINRFLNLPVSVLNVEGNPNGYKYLLTLADVYYLSGEYEIETLSIRELLLYIAWSDRIKLSEEVISKMGLDSPSEYKYVLLDSYIALLWRLIGKNSCVDKLMSTSVNEYLLYLFKKKANANLEDQMTDIKERFDVIRKYNPRYRSQTKEFFTLSLMDFFKVTYEGIYSRWLPWESEESYFNNIFNCYRLVRRLFIDLLCEPLGDDGWLIIHKYYNRVKENN